MTEEDEEFNRIEREASMRKAAVMVAITKREWIGLSLTEIRELAEKDHKVFYPEDLTFALATEAKLKEKNT